MAGKGAESMLTSYTRK
jgi:hypothetical protein